MDERYYCPIILIQDHEGQATLEDIEQLYDHPRIRHKIQPGALSPQIENQLALELKKNDCLRVLFPKNNSNIPQELSTLFKA